MFGLGFGELIVIVFIVLLLFGGKKLPQLARAFGASIGEFKKGKAQAEAIEVKAESIDSKDDNSKKKS